MSTPYRILVVEDQPGFRMVYQDALVHAGYGVLLAVDGEQGWDICRLETPDLVLLDLGLPNLDGFGVLDRIRRDSSTQDIPVVIFSVVGDQASVERAMDGGANDYVVKGLFSPLQVVGRIRCLLMGSNDCSSPVKISR